MSRAQRKSLRPYVMTYLLFIIAFGLIILSYWNDLAWRLAEAKEFFYLYLVFERTPLWYWFFSATLISLIFATTLVFLLKQAQPPAELPVVTEPPLTREDQTRELLFAWLKLRTGVYGDFDEVLRTLMQRSSPSLQRDIKRSVNLLESPQFSLTSTHELHTLIEQDLSHDL